MEKKRIQAQIRKKREKRMGKELTRTIIDLASGAVNYWYQVTIDVDMASYVSRKSRMGSFRADGGPLKALDKLNEYFEAVLGHPITRGKIWEVENGKRVLVAQTGYEIIHGQQTHLRENINDALYNRSGQNANPQSPYRRPDGAAPWEFGSHWKGQRTFPRLKLGDN